MQYHILNVPEVTVKLNMRIMHDKLSVGVDWLRDGAAVSRYFTNVPTFNPRDCLMSYSNAELPSVLGFGERTEAPIPENIYRFSACQIRVPHQEGVHAMRIMFSVGGNCPEDEQNLLLENMPLPPGQVQPVIFAEISLKDLYTGEQGMMSVGTQRSPDGSEVMFNESFDVVHCGMPAHAPENSDNHAFLDVGIKHTTHSLCSTPTALMIHEKLHHSTADINLALTQHAEERRSNCHAFLQNITDSETDRACELTMMALSMGSFVCTDKQDWTQWAKGVEIHNTKIDDLIIPDLVNACLEVANTVTLQQGLEVTPANALKAIQNTSPSDLAQHMMTEVNLQVSSRAHYAFDVNLSFDLPSVTSQSKLRVHPVVGKAGENQNPGGMHDVCSLLVNREYLHPIRAILAQKITALLGSHPDTYTHASYNSLPKKVRSLMRDFSRLNNKCKSCEGDCEDLATKNMMIFNAMFGLAQQHTDISSTDGEMSTLQSHLQNYATHTPEEASWMPVVQSMVLSVASSGRKLNSSLVFAAGASQDLAGGGNSAPTSVAGRRGVLSVIETGLMASELCGHCVACETTTRDLDPSHPAHLVLAKLQGESKCPNFSLSEVTNTRFYEATGTSIQLDGDLNDKVKVNFAPVADRNLQSNLDKISAVPMHDFQATNLITSIQAQAMNQMGLGASVVQKYNLKDPTCFYRNLIASGPGIAYTMNKDVENGVCIAPTAYIPHFNDNNFMRVLVHTDCCDKEVKCLDMMYSARQALNPTMSDMMHNDALVRVSNPPMYLRGTTTLQNQTGSVSSVVIKNACYPKDNTWTWDKEAKARNDVALSYGMSSLRHVNSDIWIANFYTNPTQ